nr:hypothetical protein [uncultured Brevundimonas sp.]
MAGAVVQEEADEGVEEVEAVDPVQIAEGLGQEVDGHLAADIHGEVDLVDGASVARKLDDAADHQGPAVEVEVVGIRVDADRLVQGDGAGNAGQLRHVVDDLQGEDRRIPVAIGVLDGVREGAFRRRWRPGPGREGNCPTG